MYIMVGKYIIASAEQTLLYNAQFYKLVCLFFHPSEFLAEYDCATFCSIPAGIHHIIWVSLRLPLPAYRLPVTAYCFARLL